MQPKVQSPKSKDVYFLCAFSPPIFNGWRDRLRLIAFAAFKGIAVSPWFSLTL
jgi:hypothetical protein